MKRKHKKEKTLYPEKWRARKNGHKNRKENCQICGSKEKLEFHHTNYIKNLGITLCFNCHRDLHKKLNNGEIQ